MMKLLEFERLFLCPTPRIYFLRMKLIVAGNKEMISIKSEIEK